ncbi:MAG: HAMP domain-containing protein, partial [Clostridia bacterium]|nr:HAMP domain-containing protein [Clostridia bacterium]
MKKRKISTKLVLWLLSVTAVIVLLSGALIAFSTYRNEMKDYSDAVFSYAKTASELIDGDRIAVYEESGETDDYFDQIQSFFTISVKETDLLYYYVFIPYEDDLMYIWDSDASEDEPPLGYREEYMKDGGKEAVEAIYRPDPPEEMKITRDETYGYIASAFYPIFNSAGEPVAVVGVDMSMPNILRQITESVAILVVSVLLITGLSVAAMYFNIRKNLVVPLGQLNSAAKETVENIDRERELDLDIHTGDELETLSDSFERMYQELRDYVKENAAITAEQERIETELSLATKIQADMLPNTFPDREDFDVFASMTPAKEVGGDFYDFFMIDDDHVGLVMADVSGKGVPAALFMVIA